MNGKQGLRLQGWEKKAGFADVDSIVPDARTFALNDVIPIEKVTDLAGVSEWNVPDGDWTIIRFGYTSTGVTNRQSPPEVLGLECDKLSEEAVRFHWDNTVAKVIADAGPLAGKTLNNILIDSYEVQRQNWTAGFDKQFEEKRGYSLLNYLPCITGRVIGSVDVSERFLWDFRRTIADVFLEKYIGTFKKLCHENGLQLSIEPYGPGNFNHLEVGVAADIPMGEFWNNAPERYSWTNKLAASAAHINNTPIVEAEAFTSAPQDAWDNYPAKLKQQGDWAFTQGVSRFVFHTFAHQPWKNVKPGMTMGPHGMMGNRNTTWWEQGREWMTYLSRCQYLLQQGTALVDLGYVLSEDAPVGNSLPRRHNLNPKPPLGYDYDFIDAGSFLKMTVQDGFVVTPSGMKYRVLLLDEKERIRPIIAKKINELIKQGANIVGPTFNSSPSLEGFPKADAEVRALTSIIPQKSLEQTLAQIQLSPDALFKYIDSVFNSNLRPMEYIHRKLENTDLYFVSNQNPRSLLVECSFRMSGMQPELWYPDKGTFEPAINFRQLNGRTLVSMNIQNMESVFVVFRKPLTAEVTELKSFTVNGKEPKNAFLKRAGEQLIVSASEAGVYNVETVEGKELQAKVKDVPKSYLIESGWKLNFPAVSGIINPVVLPKLISWTEHDNSDIKHFSGTANYEVEFELPKDLENKISSNSNKVQLDLGEVAIIASVKLNGKDLGILWKKPFSIDITNQLKKGKNKLEVKVTNLWVNRLIGDDALTPDIEYVNAGSRGRSIEKIPEWVIKGLERPNTSRKAFSTWMFFDKNSPLLESGLIGPVKLIFSSDEVFK